MPSLSDSQNLDTDPNSGSAPVLPPGSPLQVCPSCEALLDISEREPLEKIECPQCQTPMVVNGMIGHYQIVEVAGKGGMGVVYKAYDSSLDRYVAVKLLRKDHSADAKLIQQLETEAAITAAVNDSNVVRVYGTGVDRQRFYIVMELVDKGSLDDLIHLQGRVAEAQVLQVGIQVARGLKAAQQHGLIHRDVKPGNILFSDAHSAKIVDFGLAIFMEQEESVRGEVWGTPYYVAPEKLDNQPEDFRSDMYSLGGSLFHALAGRPPFEAESASLVALKHLKNQPVSLQTFAPWISNATAHIINRTLAKDPTKRFQSYDELIESFEYALEQLHSGVGNAAVHRQRAQIEAQEEQKRWTWVAIGVVGLLVVGGVGFYLSQKSAEKKAAAAVKTVQAAVRTGARYEPLQKPIEAMANFHKDATQLFDEAAKNPVLSAADRAWAELFKGASFLQVGKGNEAKAAFQEAQKLAPEIKDQTITAVIATTSKRLLDSKPIAPAEIEDLDLRGHQAASLLLYAMQTWQSGRTDEALGMFRKFRSADPAGTAEWIGQFKPVAVDYIERQTAFNIAVDRLKSATNPADRYAAAGSFSKVDRVFAKRIEEALKPYQAELAKHKAEIAKPPTSGIVKIQNRNSGKVLDVRSHNMSAGGTLSAHDSSNQTHQFFRIVQIEGDIVKFVALHSGKVLDIAGTPADGAKVIQADDKGTPTQKWQIVSKGDANFKLRNVGADLFMAPISDKRDAGLDVVVKKDHEPWDIQWQFPRVATPVGELAGFNIGSCKGGYEFKDGVYKIRNASRDIWGGGDNFGFAFKEMTGDFELVAHLAEITDVQGGAKVGLALRQGLNGDDPTISLVTLTDGNLSPQSRVKKPGETAATKIPNKKAPIWLKLVRKGEVVTSYSSADGATWEQAGTATVLGMKGSVYAGLAVTSHNPDKEITAKYDNVKFSPAAK